MFLGKKACEVKILALYGYGRRAVVKMDFAKIEEPHSKTKAKRVLLVAPVPISDIPEDVECIVLENPGGMMNVPEADICFRHSSVCLTTTERSSSPQGYFADVLKSGSIYVSGAYYARKRVPCGVLTVSDKGSRGERHDTSGPALVSRCREDGFEVVRYEVVPDEVEVIQSAVRRWIREGVLLIVTTGGTGLSRRDVTPEALRSLSTVEVPGIGEMIRSQSLQYTPMAALSRCGGFVSESCLIIALPGSERGAVQSYEIISATLRHAVEIRNGWAEECGSTVNAASRKG
jgi:molybdenum cofactor synthesis domain-containing protein